MRRSTTALLVSAMLLPSAAALAAEPATPVGAVAVVERAAAEAFREGWTEESAARPAPGEAGEVFVQLDRALSDAGRERVLAVADLLGEVADTVEGAVDGFVVDLPAGAAADLAELPGVVRIEENARYESSAAASWGLDRVRTRDLGDRAPTSRASAGAGVTVYVLDSGVYTAHEDFGGRASIGYDRFAGKATAEGGAITNACYDHGTHVAGTVAGSDFGVAPAAKIVSVRAIDCSGGASLSDVIGAIAFIINHASSRSSRAVVNMSLGGQASDVLDEAIQALVDAGIVVVVASGNDGINACDVSPARLPAALTVGASDRDDTAAVFSNWGSCVDLHAPGIDIVSAAAGNAGAATFDGTSMASPHVAGIAARFLSTNPSASVDAVHAAVVAGATTNRLRDTFGTDNLLAYADLGPGRLPDGSASSCDAASASVAAGSLARGQAASLPVSAGVAHAAGKHTACMIASAGVDYDLSLQKLSGATWNTVATSRGTGGDEQISYVGGAGVYRWVIDGVANAGTLVLFTNGPADRVRDASIEEIASYHASSGSWSRTDVGTGEQTHVTTYGTRSGWQTHLAADVAGDATPELVSYHSGNGTWWRTDAATGAQRQITRYGTPTGWSAHLAADMNGDGNTDLLSFHPASGRWWLTDMSSGTAKQRILTTYGTKSGWQTHRIGDLDGDGTLELISYHEPSGRWWATRVLSTGRASSRLVTSYGTASGWSEHLVGDVTGDGRIELLSYHATSGRWWSTRLTRTGAASQSILTTYGTRSGWSAHTLSDTDGNGTVDLLSFNAEDGVWWRTGVDNGAARKIQVLTAFGTKDGWQAHLPTDFDS